MSDQHRVDAARLVKLLAAFALCGVPAAVGRDVVGSAAGLFSLAETPHPYFAAARAALLCVWNPLVVASASVLMFAPGLCLALLVEASTTMTRWVFCGFGLSLAVLPVVTPAVESLTRLPLRGGLFLAVLAACTLAAWMAVFVRTARGRPLVWPFAAPGAVATLAGMFLVPLALLIALIPKFYWDNFNGDGAHAFEAARLLVTQAVPFFGPAARNTADFPGMTSMLFVFPASWFIRLFGPLEVSIRLSLLLYLPLLFAGIVDLADHGRSRPLSAIERWIIWLPIIVYVVVMAYSATYNPYSADIALPATQDTLQIVWIFGVILAFLRKERVWLVLFTAFAYTTSPNGAMLVALWLMSVWLIWRPRRYADLTFAAVVVIGCAIVAAAAPFVLTLLHQPVPGREYALRNFLVRFAFLQWWDWRRLLFAVVPCGILPVVAIFDWRSQDHIARALTVMSLAYFVFFFVQALTVIHYFVPTMLLPIVIFWRGRLALDPAGRTWVPALTVAGALVALMISIPADASPHPTARRIGATMDAPDDGYDARGAVAIGRSEVLAHLFPFDWDPAVPDTAYGGSPLVWNYYAHQPKSGPYVAQYVILEEHRPAPPGMSLLARDAGAALYFRDPNAMARDRTIKLPSPAGSPVYFIPRWMIFRSIPVARGQRPLIAVVDILEHLGFPMDGVLRAFGEQR